MAQRNQVEPQVTKRKVVMTTVSVVPGMTEKGKPVIGTWEKVDYVREDFLDAYVADAATRWQSVVVADGYDAGPAGYDGATYVDPRLDHPLAGTYFPANGCGPNCSHAPDGARVVIPGSED